MRAKGRGPGIQRPPPGTEKAGLKKAGRTARYCAKKGRTAMAGGGPPPPHAGPERQKRTAPPPRGRPAAAPVSLSRQRLRSIGAPGGGAPCCAFHGKASSGACCGLLRGLRRKFGRVPPSPDDAPCRRPTTVREYPAKTYGDVRARHFPPHAPGPSPAGGQWRPVKKAVASTPCKDTDDMAGAIRTTTMMMSGETAIAKLSRYLTP